MATTYEVEKFGRGGDGSWFGFGSRRFATLEAATDYLVHFAASQSGVLGAGIRIDLRIRRGRRVLATVGGLSDLRHARDIRWLDL